MYRMSGVTHFFKRNAAAYLFLTPWLIGFFILTLYPLAYSLGLSFTNYDFTKPDSTEWIGLGNYLKMFGSLFGLSQFTAVNGEMMRVDPYYLKSLSVTLIYVFVSVPLKLVFALAVAVLMNQKLRGISFYRVVYYIPTLLGGSVAIAVLWRKLFEKDGLINGVLSAFGFTDLPSWITNPNFALGTLILLSVWQFGSSMIIFLAGLQGIPDIYYEAAEIDGAGRWAKMRYITLPMMSPIFFFNLVIGFINSFQAFTLVYLITDGGPQNSTLFLVLYIYRSAFTSLKMGYAATLSWLLFFILMVLSFIVFKYIGSRVYYENPGD